MKGGSMMSKVSHIPSGVLVGLGAILMALLLAMSLALFTASRSTSTAFAAMLQRATATTCVQAPTMEHCNNQDPQRQGCAADAQTIGLPAVIKENGVPIGSVERRYSAQCHSWWGRVFDTRSGSQVAMG